MAKVVNLLRPDKETSGTADVIFLIVSLFWLAPYIYYVTIAPSKGYEYGGGPAGSSGILGDVVGFALVALLVAVFFVALCRLLYRIVSKYVR